MKRFQQLFAVTLITLVLTVSTFAGDMGFPAASATPTGDGDMGFPAAMSTDSTEAMLNVLQSILAAF